MLRRPQILERALLLTAMLASTACVEDEAERLDLAEDDAELVALDEAEGELLAPEGPEPEPTLFELPPITLDCTTIVGVDICEDKAIDWVAVQGTSNHESIDVYIRRDYANSRVQVRMYFSSDLKFGHWYSSYFNFDPQDPSALSNKLTVTVELLGDNDRAEIYYMDSFDGSTFIEGEPSDNTFVVGGGGDDSLYYFRDADGGDGADYIIGTSKADYFEGGSGADTIRSYGGDDEIYGQGGADELEGGNGNNLIYGGDGKDELVGGIGNDELHGGGNDDRLWAFGGNDILRGNGGEDYLNGGNGIDDCDGGNGNDDFQDCE